MMVLRSGWSRRPWLKRCGQVLAGLILVVLLLPPLLDRPAPETIPDPRQEVADADNAVVALAAAMAKAPNVPPNYPSPSDPSAMAYVARCAEVLREADAALAKPDFLIPPQTTSDPKTVVASFKASGSLRSYARLKLQHAYWSAHHGDLPGALADLRTTRGVTERAAQSTGSLIGWLVACATDAIALRGYETLLGPAVNHAADPTKGCQASGWSPQVAALWRREMADLAHSTGEPATLRRSLAAEYHYVSDNLHGLGEHATPMPRFPTWFYLPKQSINLASRGYREAIDRLDLPSWQRPALDPRRSQLSAGDRLWNPVGKALSSVPELLS